MTYYSISYVFRELKNRIKRYYENGLISDQGEREKIKAFLDHKRFNPYCYRTSAIREDAETLSSSNLEIKVGWRRGSKMVKIYLDKYMSKTFKKQLLLRAGIKIDYNIIGCSI
jgi:hypothetical protein